MNLRDLPPVDRVVESLGNLGVPRALLVSETRRVIESMRVEIRADQTGNTESAADRVRRSLEDLQRPSLRRVINATGVVLHTNLGRAPIANFPLLEGYSNLEYDLARGQRGKRDAHVSGLLDRLAGKPGIAVNNNAAAVLLTLHELARDGEAIVSRGELIEIGDGFRIPDIMETSGARLREVGTTNRTHIDDYRAAIGERTRVLMRVHPSNFHIEGFTAKPELAELAALAQERGLPLYEDLGSGCVADLARYGISEPRVSQSLDSGANLVSFSGDKLLGGPQAGLIVGDGELVSRLRRNPLFRALRLDKIITQALENTLRHLVFERWDEVPALRMIRLTSEEIRERAEGICRRVPNIEIIEGRSVAGGGSTPDQSLPTWLLVLPGDAVDTERALRAGTPPVIGRIENDRLVLDLRTVSPSEEEVLVRILLKEKL